MISIGKIIRILRFLHFCLSSMYCTLAVERSTKYTCIVDKAIMIGGSPPPLQFHETFEAK
jgi:hypothetical protein